ncbi:MAG: MFS transporter, partial [Actinomycetota bacterium]|nr:MFS transporter [Actinomycetota bacterium]
MVDTADRPDLATGPPTARWPGALVFGVVALAFADASIVVLGLADIYGEMDVGIVAVSWVVTAYAAAVVVVAAGLALLGGRVAPPLALGAGLVLFAAGSVGSAAASTIEVLIGARTVQGVGAALLLSATLPTLTAVVGAPDRAVRSWSAAGVVGAVLGPAVGGLLTQVFDWRAIFWVQAPVAVAALAVLALPAVRAAASSGPVAEPTSDDEPDGTPGVRGVVLANIAFGLLFAAAVGALFLTVLCAIEVWRFEPLGGALVVSALPAATLVAHPLVVRLGLFERVVVGVGSLVCGLSP